ncbi:Putative transport protein; permease of the drug/metabolite transporter (DMT) superfamily [Neorhizobium galegae bv. officinalis bv. officinalis str. HAMBI 1141]|uniref:Putative transport protein permease of the drug/metabolite transporter (DMT) superfamily n=1 Tax=Neorhizobium galegae bv. officinalis bv. officinalis str. HAMBI 1141 TaxID=1028801 RepID=A0A068TCN0_NEOGA|nr:MULTISPECIES: DMT family transporter [Neorhizobium]MCJ9751970.1 DMT family transporter [Neorhizobium sp. BETTINA12A]CDN55120.1 Putative transport protein; permease of the drug/metabolite transporter (DMT) superfamily [Neorhizobium galegae bv. officinalis bv. officinalis str. HAMBI 1141]
MHKKAYLSLVIATLAWGGNAVAGKLAVGHVSPMMLTFWRWFFAVAIIFAISVPQLIKDWPVVRKNLPILLFLGVVGYVVFNGALYTAVNYTTAINVTVEQAVIPMLIFVINFALFRMKVSWAQILGFTLTLLGGIITAIHGDLSALVTLTVNFGDAIMMIAVVAYAIYTVALRWRPKIDWRTLMAVPAFFAMVFSLPLVFWEYSADRVIWPDAKGWVVVLYTGIFASLIAQVLYIKGVEEIGGNRAGLFINLVPVFGTLLSVAIIGESLQLFHIVALALALGGIAIAEWGKPHINR